MLVVAKAPVPGRVKTRLGADIGERAAAEVAAASLLDTLAACTAAAGAELCHLALDGDLADAVRGPELEDALAGWSTSGQHGDGLAARLVRAHLDVPGAGPVVQIGMDTPQVTPDLLRAAAEGTAEHDAVLGPAEDGGWWVLAVRDARSAGAIAEVPMSGPTTYDDTRAALRGAGLSVGGATAFRNVDTVADARTVAVTAPGGHFARTWREFGSRS